MVFALAIARAVVHAMVGLDDNSIRTNSRPESVRLFWGSAAAAAWGCSTLGYVY